MNAFKSQKSYMRLYSNSSFIMIITQYFIKYITNHFSVDISYIRVYV